MEQVIEVDYNKELVEEYKNNYIMEEEGIGADDVTPYGEQTTFNTDSLDELVTDGSTVDEVVELEEKEGE